MKETKPFTPGENSATPMLFPYEPEQFWQHLKFLIRDEISRMTPMSASPPPEAAAIDPKPLYKITEVCQLFQVTKPTVYSWIEHGKLHPVKIRSRVFFLWQDIQNLLTGSRKENADEQEK